MRKRSHVPAASSGLWSLEVVHSIKSGREALLALQAVHFTLLLTDAGEQQRGGGGLG